jgi:transcriptional regulator with XRE-family HTH domain
MSGRVPNTALRNWRLAQGWSLGDAARYLDIPKSTYYVIELGRKIPRPNLRDHIAERTGVSKAAIVQAA